TRTDTPLNEIPMSISVITAEQVRDQNAQTIQEVLRYTAGVSADVYGLDNRGDWFSLRGGSEGSTLVDGLRRPLSGWYGVVRDEPFAFERIEVLRGPSSVITGQNGPGGVVNLVSKRPQAEAAREVQVQVGNNDHKQIAADLTGPLTEDGRLAYRVLALRRDSGTQVEHADIERTLFAPSLQWQATPDTRLW
ncbi:TonB-dependent siderophore receptor, partial [Rubrivivax gelatinosus]|nr:TonB-dependent siderophore receptor [Rubrivivax gelatinosus]